MSEALKQALDGLMLAYSRGEIDRATYDERRAVLIEGVSDAQLLTIGVARPSSRPMPVSGASPWPSRGATATGDHSQRRRVE